MNNKEAIEILGGVIRHEAQVGLARRKGPSAAKPIMDSWFAALTHLTKLAEENDNLITEVSHLQNDLFCADKANAALKHIAECAATPLMADVLKERDELKAEVERLKDELAKTTKLWSTAETDATHLYARMMKAEAELEKARPLRPEVLLFAGLMETELKKHDDRPGWKECDPFWLMRRVREELDELEYALLDHSESIGHEAADVANFAMMIADVNGALSYRERKGEGKNG